MTPRRPLPLDPDFVAGRISAEALVAMGYRDAWSYLERRPVDGGPLDHTASKVGGRAAGVPAERAPERCGRRLD